MAGNRYGLPSGFDATLKPSVSELTGIEGLEIQDVCITESMGPITDRAFEHLVPSDIMVARTRRRLLHAATALRDEGTIPPRVDAPAAYASVPGAEFTNAEKGISFDEVYRAGTEKAPSRETADG